MMAIRDAVAERLDPLKTFARDAGSSTRWQAEGLERYESDAPGTGCIVTRQEFAETLIQGR